MYLPKAKVATNCTTDSSALLSLHSWQDSVIPQMDTFITWIDAAWEIHGLQVVMAAFFMFFQRAALLVTATTVSTLMGFANWRKHNSVWDSEEAFNSILTMVRTRDKKPTPKIKPCCGEGRFCQLKKKTKWKQLMENWLYSFTSTGQFYGCCKLILDDSDQIKTVALNLSKQHLHRLETVTPSKAWEHLL